MRLRLVAVILAVLALAVSCKSPSVKGYWEKHTPDISDIRAAENEFAAFAELAVGSPEQEAREEIDRLFEQLRANEVAYFVYSEWIVSAFYSPASPCRDCALFSYAMTSHVLKDGIVDGYDAELYERLVTACNTNKEGTALVLPPLNDRRGNDVTIEPVEPILFLVVDLSCPSCLKALDKLSKKYPEARHIALCSGPATLPDRTDWEFLRATETDSVYDISAAPFYFVVNSEGIIEKSYTTATL